ncbi:hypothetical protein [Streptomyces lonarensis]|uniref:Flp pilus-assembly TadG-like N-terminal domain-containing protein n=1 Tax=Streptomyces lonarensis TaxID=700599 RepID=A0A7X6D2B8_9ACTN|nr:hypothetical protein [Streptomyces lonarensis]NJQ06905.1 hypothetical protein [Streptomyces lonarensis]
MVSGLLLIAMIFFVFAQAAVTRGGGQSAADAAALAAVREARDGLHDRFREVLEDEEADLAEILDGLGFLSASACAAAADLAARNNASVTDCAPVAGRAGYRVTIETRNTVGDSVLPGTSNATATASAVAVILPLCRPLPGDERTELDCEEREWALDPEDPDQLPEPRDLFRIRLED